MPTIFAALGIYFRFYTREHEQINKDGGKIYGNQKTMVCR